MKLKRSLFFAAICAFGVTAHAQSSVTLYGILDEGLMFSSNVNGGKRVYMDALGGIHGSRWGFIGKEDLGGGLQAIFQLESGINLNSGAFAQGGTAFGRQAYVGLNSQQYGSLTFGRQYDMIFYFPEALTAAGLIGSVVFGHPGDLDNTANSVRLNNAVRYMSPKFGGFSFGGEYSVGGVPGNTTANSGYSVGAGYSYGPIQLGAAFEYFKNPTSSTPGQGFFTAYANGVSLLSQALNKGYTSANAYQVAVVAGTYTIGPTTLIASASNVQYANLGGTLQGGTARFNNIDVGAQYKVTPAFILSAEYEYLIGKGVQTTTGSVVGNQHFNQIAAMADYLFSKRTDIYLEGGWQRASGTSSIGTPAVADFTNQGDSSNNHQFLARLALRHKF